jgi:DNA-binding winged helix-turn-helix (wHTH) protein
MRYAFEGCVVDTDAFELHRDGEPVDVEPQVFDVLLHLLRHRDRLVTRDELLDEVWGDRFVSASALNSRLKAARRAIGDDGRAQRLIRTVHGRGYRFVAPVVERSDDRTDVATRPASAEPVPAGVSTPVREEVVRAPPIAGTGPATVGRTATVGTGRRRWPFTGRPGPLQLLGEAHRRGEGGAVLIGPAGVGKTRLADEVLAIAEQEGHPTARAVGHASASEIPLGALAHLLPAGLVAGIGIGDERTALFHAARHEFAATTAGRRMILFVDDINLLDRRSR